ncbi:uncharacterized protein VTP21DRAFT_2292 [Calcarisporiella thermophila]|uniref:uncharacterized protein n=1 Tax=Calcarisporiella thermophila TaxID=911321 RepID=UPI003743B9AE
MGESRTELLAWLNDLLQVNYQKIEQCGTGAAYCQILDSIYGDLPMNKVKFVTKHEYEYVDNFKVLQRAFDRHKLDKPIPVERLIKCKMQDNLEFLQWLKRFWDQHFPGGEYDALARRKGQGLVDAKPIAGRPSSRTGAGAVRPSSRTQAFGSGRISASGTRAGADPGTSKMIVELNKQLGEMKIMSESLEHERDFYFGKLRDIEVLVQQQLETAPDGADSAVLREIQAILYSTEEGFEAPQDAGLLEEGVVDEEETF